MHSSKILNLVQLISDKSDQNAFAELYKIFFPGLFTFAQSMLHNREKSTDVVENVFIKVWENRNTLATIKNLSHYLYVSVKHAALNLRRQKSFVYEDLNEDNFLVFENIENKISSTENLTKIENAINSLPARCRLVFRLIKDEGLKNNEVAQLLEISVSTVENQMTIALKKIADNLHAVMPEYNRYFKAKNKY